MSSGAIKSGGGSRTNPSWLQYSGFHANDTMITIVPNFSSTRSMPLLSCAQATSVGPFVAGMPCQVPLWMAKLLHQRQLAQIQLPDWLSSSPITITSHIDDDSSSPFPSSSFNRTAPYLVQALHEEKTQSSLLPSDRLPFYYYEIARALSPASSGSGGGGGGGGGANTDAMSSSSTSLVEQSMQLVIQDLHTVRVDKIRQHFHELSREELSRTYMDAEHSEPTHMIEVTGIASMELAAVGPFLKQAFTDYGILCQKTDDEDNEDGRDQDGTTTGDGSGFGKENDKDSNRGDSAEGDGSPATSKADRQRTNLLRSRLRRFRS